MVKLFVDAGLIALTPFISPYRKDRDRIRDLVGENHFFEIYVNCPVDVCAQRDPKGIYAKAKAGLIKDFTGISAPYEPPESPGLMIATDRTSAADAAKQIFELLRSSEIVP